MSIISWLKGVWSKLFKKEIEQKFNADILLSDVMENWIAKFYRITSGSPYWINEDDDIESINFAGFISDTTAGLETLDLGIEMPDTPRGKYLQEQADYILQAIQDKVSEGLGNCGIMFKPNGRNVDYIEPGNFAPTETDSNGNILGCVFQSQIRRGGHVYTKLEYHRFEDGRYRITNYAFKARNAEGNPQVGIGDQCLLTEVKEWADIVPDVTLDNVEKPLFAYFKNPAPNRLDRSSSLGVPIWNNALKELKDLDIAWSRKSTEIEDSKHMTFMDESTVMFSKQKKTKLPRFVKAMDMGVSGGAQSIHEHTATLLTADRIADINSILAMIGTKCGFSQGFFVLDEKTGVVTATQVESDDQETIRTIKNLRDALQTAVENLFYGLNIMADLYSDLPAEDWETLKDQITYRWGDPTFNADEDRARAMMLTDKGFYPKDYYLHKWEGYSEDEAAELIQKAQAQAGQPDAGLFGEE